MQQKTQLLPLEFNLIVTSRDSSNTQKLLALETISYISLLMLVGFDATKESLSDIKLYTIV